MQTSLLSCRCSLLRPLLSWLVFFRMHKLFLFAHNSRIIAFFLPRFNPKNTVPTVKYSSLGQCFVFQHDVPKHASLLMYNYLQKAKVTIIDWPEQSFDLNSTETLGQLRSCARDLLKMTTNYCRLLSIKNDTQLTISIGGSLSVVQNACKPIDINSPTICSSLIILYSRLVALAMCNGILFSQPKEESDAQ